MILRDRSVYLSCMERSERVQIEELVYNGEKLTSIVFWLLFFGHLVAVVDELRVLDFEAKPTIIHRRPSLLSRSSMNCAFT